MNDGRWDWITLGERAIITYKNFFVKTKAINIYLNKNLKSYLVCLLKLSVNNKVRNQNNFNDPKYPSKNTDRVPLKFRHNRDLCSTRKIFETWLGYRDLPTQNKQTGRELSKLVIKLHLSFISYWRIRPTFLECVL